MKRIREENVSLHFHRDHADTKPDLTRLQYCTMLEIASPHSCLSHDALGVTLMKNDSCLSHSVARRRAV